MIVYACKNTQKCHASYTYVLAWLHNLRQLDLYNQRSMGEQICDRIQVLRLSNCLHNLTLIIILDYTVKHYDTTYICYIHAFDSYIAIV